MIDANKDVRHRCSSTLSTQTNINVLGQWVTTKQLSLNVLHMQYKCLAIFHTFLCNHSSYRNTHEPRNKRLPNRSFSEVIFHECFREQRWDGDCLFTPFVGTQMKRHLTWTPRHFLVWKTGWQCMNRWTLSLLSACAGQWNAGLPRTASKQTILRLRPC